MANPVGYQGRGTIIAFTVAPVTGGSVYTAMPQLEKFEKTSAKVDFDDATCLDSPGVNKFPIPVVVDNGKWTGEGVFDPQNAGITALMGYMQALTQLGSRSRWSMEASSPACATSKPSRRPKWIATRSTHSASESTSTASKL